MSARVAAWLASAIEDAERRGLPDLKPLLEGLARSTASLRAAELEHLREMEQEAAAPSPGDSDG